MGSDHSLDAYIWILIMISLSRDLRGTACCILEKGGDTGQSGHCVGPRVSESVRMNELS